MRKMSVSRFLLIAAIAALVLMISACAFVAPPPQALTLDALKNAEYNSDLPAAKKAKLTNGVYEEEIVPGSASKLTIRLRDQYATGDLNGDGVADAAVVLAGNSGGSGVFVTLEAVVNDGGKPKHVASADLGDRTVIKSVSIADGIIVMDLTTHSPTDPMCCPTQNETDRFKLQGAQLVRIQ
jgi:hypothetical protein